MGVQTTDALRDRVRALLPAVTQELAELVSVPSVSAPGYPTSTHSDLLAAHDMVARLLREAGCETDSIELPDTAPVVFGEIPAPPGAPTVLLYSHYDVVPEGDASLWESAAFAPTVRDGAVFGRGAADTKSNILSIVGALRAWGGRPPVGVKVVVEHGGGRRRRVHHVPARAARAVPLGRDVHR